ncbi:MAG: FtsQ-type POTRA domain-containing protein [Patescibacteria group bacterium]
MFRISSRSKRQRGFRKREIKVVNKPVYKNPYFKKKRPGIILRLLNKPKLIIMYLCIGGLIYLFFYAPYFTIKEVEINGNQELSYDTIRFEVNKSFIERRFFIFKQSNLFMLNSNKSKERLWDTFVLNKVTVTKRFPNKLVVNLEERIPNLTLMTQKSFYYMDREGVVTNVVPEAEIKEYFPKVEDLNQRTIKLKDKIISSDLVNAIFIIKDSFSTKTNTDIDRFLIPETTCSSIQSDDENDPEILDNINISNSNTNKSALNTNRAIKNSNAANNLNKSQTKEIECNLVQAIQDIAVLTTEGWKAYFTINDDIATQLERLKVYLLKKAADKETRENIDYIDLRFGEKIYIME